MPATSVPWPTRSENGRSSPVKSREATTRAPKSSGTARLDARVDDRDRGSLPRGAAPERGDVGRLRPELSGDEALVANGSVRGDRAEGRVAREREQLRPGQACLGSGDRLEGLPRDAVDAADARDDAVGGGARCSEHDHVELRLRAGRRGRGLGERRRDEWSRLRERGGERGRRERQGGGKRQPRGLHREPHHDTVPVLFARPLKGRVAAAEGEPAYAPVLANPIRLPGSRPTTDSGRELPHPGHGRVPRSGERSRSAEDAVEPATR